MFRKIDKILAAFGNMRAMQRTHIDTYTENRMKAIKGIKIAGEQSLGIWIDFKELAGFTFLELTMLSKTNIRTFKGIELSFLGGEMEMFLESDTKEIVSDYSNVSDRWMVQASFEVCKEDIDFIENKGYEILRIKNKNNSIDFPVLVDALYKEVLN